MYKVFFFFHKRICLVQMYRVILFIWSLLMFLLKVASPLTVACRGCFTSKVKNALIFCFWLVLSENLWLLKLDANGE